MGDLEGWVQDRGQDLTNQEEKLGPSWGLWKEIAEENRGPLQSGLEGGSTNLRGVGWRGWGPQPRTRGPWQGPLTEHLQNLG